MQIEQSFKNRGTMLHGQTNCPDAYTLYNYYLFKRKTSIQNSWGVAVAKVSWNRSGKVLNIEHQDSKNNHIQISKVEFIKKYKQNLIIFNKNHENCGFNLELGIFEQQ